MVEIQQFLLIFSLLKTNVASVKLFKTENTISVQSYDCVYYTNMTASNIQAIPYCIRTSESISLNRSFTCGNSGQQWTFRQLKAMNISVDEVLTWNSSIEMADRYAAYLTSLSGEFNDQQICNCSSKTFGKFCEYQFLTTDTLEQTIAYQFHLKEKYRIGSQLWGNITCYTTLSNCYYGLRCLTWQNICDRKQQCMYGIDEDHCERLEYNECDENEYRCDDGSCIAEDYWLDGEYDCADKSDEQYSSVKFIKRRSCALISSEFDCDEAIADDLIYFACGDGEFVLDGSAGDYNCYNYRLAMFFCEFSWGGSEEHPTWTLENGHCVNQGWLERNLTDMSESEICVLVLKCQLTDGASDICEEILERFSIVCEERSIVYPSESIICPYLKTVYELIGLNSSAKPSYLLFNGSMKCPGREQFYSSTIDWSEFQLFYFCEVYFCNKSTTIEIPNDPCGGSSKSSYFCPRSLQCISKYRLQNGHSDCYHAEDESDEHQYWLTKPKHRLKCSGSSSKYLPISLIGDRVSGCKESNDEYLAEFKWRLIDYHCKQRHSKECTVLKAYIQSSSLLTMIHEKIIPFRRYCDSYFDLPKGFDESRCNNWKCLTDQYQCLTGHCIPSTYVKHTHTLQWNCPDASDNIGLFRSWNLSDHNVRLLTSDNINSKKEAFFSELFLKKYHSFPRICNYTMEYGCLLSNVDNPFDFQVNRPCINLTQIGDGIIDCYGGLDERNRLTCGQNLYDQLGFDFHCSDDQCIPYHRLCKDRCTNNADYFLCQQLHIYLNPFCEHETHIDICSSTDSNVCYSIGVGNYYCDVHRGVHSVSAPYRSDVWHKEKPWVRLLEYPSSKIVQTSERIRFEYSQTNAEYPEVFDNNGREGWICGRGMAIKGPNSNQIQCFCPPSLYGEYCQYYSDRITIITNLANISLELIEEERNIIKICVFLLSNDDIVDEYIFHLPLILSKELDKKFRFNLIHPRPKQSSNSFKVRFEAYNLNIDTTIDFLSVWEYPIHFPFLPSVRLAQVLRFNSNITLLPLTHICKRANPCLHNSTCHAIVNQINDLSAFYCLCNNQTFGKHCEQFWTSGLASPCSRYARFRPISSWKFLCLCPSYLYGPTCHLNHTCVTKNPCQHDRGKCYPNPDNITQDYICICNKKFFGEQCQINSAMVQINLTDFLFVQIPSKFILSSIIQLCDLQNQSLDLIIREKHVYQGLPPSIIEIYHNGYHLPRLGILKLYHQLDFSNEYIANLNQLDHFLLYSISSTIPRMNITLMINRTNYCPSTSILFQNNLSNISHLFQIFNYNPNNQLNTSTLIFQYHLLCHEEYSLLCFHDENYYCLCDEDHRAECFRYNPTLDECQGRCRAGGQCIRGDLDDRKDFLCLCPRCYHGSICQHNTELFSFTLETLLTKDLYSTSMAIQKIFFSLLIIIPSILFLIAAVNNTLGYVTFNRSKPLLVGTGHYLRVVSIVNQIAVLMLLFKLLHLVLSLKGYFVHQLLNTILCKVLSYLLVCSSRISYWLMGMIAVERVYVTWSLRGIWLKSPRIAKRIIATIILAIIACDIHELIFYQSIDDPKSLDTNNSTWCVTSYPSGVSTYNQVNVILNYILPFLINLFSTIFLIILIVRKRTKAKKLNRTTSEMNIRLRFRVYLDLLKKYKELILPPSVTMLPQLFSHSHLLVKNLHSLGNVLMYKLYISPSSFYTEEFRATNLYQTIARWRR